MNPHIANPCRKINEAPTKIRGGSIGIRNINEVVTKSKKSMGINE